MSTSNDTVSNPLKQAQPYTDTPLSRREREAVSGQARWTPEQAAERRAFRASIRAKLQSVSTGTFAALMERRSNPNIAAMERTLSRLETIAEAK